MAPARVRRQTRDLRLLLEPGRDHHVRRRIGALRRDRPGSLPSIGSMDEHARVVPNRQREPLDVPLEVGDDLVARHEAIAVGAVVLGAGHLAASSWA